MVEIALIGCGYWGPNLIRNFVATPGAKLRAVCDRDPARLGPILEQYPSVEGTTDVESIMASDVDAVVISTPVHTHADLAGRALDAGKHVLVEKPMSHSVESAARLVEKAEAMGLVLQVDHTFVYSPAIRAIRTLLDEGALGDLLYVDSVRINLGLFQSDVSVVWDLAAHDVSIIDHLIDLEPLSVSAVGSAHYGTLENLAYLTLTYPDSLIAHAHVNWLAPVKLRSTLVGGSKRMVLFDDLSPSEKIRIYDRGVSMNGEENSRERLLVDYRMGAMTAPYVEKVEPLRLVCADFVQAIAERRKPLVDGEAGFRVVRILAAVEESIRKGGQPISFAEA